MRQKIEIMNNFVIFATADCYLSLIELEFPKKKQLDLCFYIIWTHLEQINPSRNRHIYTIYLLN